MNVLSVSQGLIDTQQGFPLKQEGMCKPQVANMAAAKDHLVPSTFHVSL